MTLPVTPPEGTPPATPPTPAPATPPEPEDELVKLIKADPNRTAEEIRSLRHEAAENRKKAQEAEDKRKADEAKALEEQGKYKELAEKREQEIKALKDGQRAGEIRTTVLLEAAKAGIADPADALKLADLSKVDVSEGGAVTGVAEAIAALIKAKPYLAKPSGASQPNIGATNPAGGPAMNAADFRNMTPRQIASMDPEIVRAALSGGKKD